MGINILYKIIFIFSFVIVLSSCSRKPISYIEDKEIVIALYSQQDTLTASQQLPLVITITNKGKKPTKRLNLNMLRSNSAGLCFEMLPWELLVTHENGTKMWSNLRDCTAWSSPENTLERVKPNETKTLNITMSSLENTSWYSGDEKNIQTHEAIKGKYRIQLVYEVYTSSFSRVKYRIKSNELIVNYK